jgi:glycosyltransferase involved in cell wall biosynthesis
VHFLDRVPYDSYLALLQVSSAHVYLTYPFVLSWSLVEAMAAGCTIVASDTAPVREAIENGVSGLLAPFHDPKAIAEAAIAVLSEPGRYASLGKAAREAAAERFDKRTCVPRALSLIGADIAASVSSDVGELGIAARECA